MHVWSYAQFSKLCHILAGNTWEKRTCRSGCRRGCRCFCCCRFFVVVVVGMRRRTRIDIENCVLTELLTCTYLASHVTPLTFTYSRYLLVQFIVRQIAHEMSLNSVTQLLVPSNNHHTHTYARTYLHKRTHTYTHARKHTHKHTHTSARQCSRRRLVENYVSPDLLLCKCGVRRTRPRRSTKKTGSSHASALFDELCL